MKLFDTKLITLFFMIAGIYFVFSATVMLDPDFGWHVAMGDLIIQSGIPQTDPFSYTMSSFPFIDHEWLTNVFFSQSAPIFGQFGLALYFSFLLFVTIKVVILISHIVHKEVSKKKHHPLIHLPIVMGLAAIFPFFGIRPQVQSWLLFAIWIFILFEKKLLKKWWWLTPVFILFWTNLHGSFPLSLVTLAIYIFIKSYYEKRVWFFGSGLLVLSTLATFINPYGPEIWHEVFQQISDTQLKWRVSEWQPSIFSVHLSFVFLATLSSTLIFKYWKKLPKELLGISLFLLSQSIVSIRHVPLWIIATTPLFVSSLYFFQNDMTKIKLGKKRFDIGIKYTMYLAMVLFLFQSSFHIYRLSIKLHEAASYPKAAISFLQKENPEGNVFAVYEWGGYLIWKYPEKKVFIDGRMPSWRWTENPTNESANAMDDYLALTSGKIDSSTVFEKFNITTILIPNTKNKDKTRVKLFEEYIQNRLDIDTKEFIFSEELESNGWEIVYSDEISLVYQQSTMNK